VLVFCGLAVTGRQRKCFAYNTMGLFGEIFFAGVLNTKRMGENVMGIKNKGGSRWEK